jgi:hypothetical protein
MKVVSSDHVFRRSVESYENYITCSPNHIVTKNFFIALFPNDGNKTFLSPFLHITWSIKFLLFLHVLLKPFS